MPACFSDAISLIDVIRFEPQPKHPFAIRLEGSAAVAPAGGESPRRSLPRRARPNATPEAEIFLVNGGGIV